MKVSSTYIHIYPANKIFSCKLDSHLIQPFPQRYYQSDNFLLLSVSSIQNSDICRAHSLQNF